MGWKLNLGIAAAVASVAVAALNYYQNTIRTATFKAGQTVGQAVTSPIEGFLEPFGELANYVKNLIPQSSTSGIEPTAPIGIAPAGAYTGGATPPPAGSPSEDPRTQPPAGSNGYSGGYTPPPPSTPAPPPPSTPKTTPTSTQPPPTIPNPLPPSKNPLDQIYNDLVNAVRNIGNQIQGVAVPAIPTPTIPAVIPAFGEEGQYYTVTLKSGKVAHVTQATLNALASRNLIAHFNPEALTPQEAASIKSKVNTTTKAAYQMGNTTNDYLNSNPSNVTNVGSFYDPSKVYVAGAKLDPRIYLIGGA